MEISVTSDDQGQLRKFPDPIVTAKEDRCFQPYVSVLCDGEKFRMWYNMAVSERESCIGYLESLNGIQWKKPSLLLNIPGGVVFGASVLEDLSDGKERRYKLAYWNKGLRIACSYNGLDWKLIVPEAVIKEAGDIVSIMRDPKTSLYHSFFKVNSLPEDGYCGKTPNAPEGYRRCVGHSVSKDCLIWSNVERIIKPDEYDEGITEFYGLSGVRRIKNFLIGFLKVLRDDLSCDHDGPANGIGYTVLAWSYDDGKTWERARQPFFDRNKEPVAWDHAVSWIDCSVEIDDTMYLYYGGYARGHKIGKFSERQIGVAFMKSNEWLNILYSFNVQ